MPGFVFMQDHQGISNVAPADAPLRSIPIQKVESDSAVDVVNNVVEARIHDYINNLQFCISPTAFFQVRMSNCSWFLVISIYR